MSSAAISCKHPLYIVTPGATISYQDARLIVSYKEDLDNAPTPQNFPIRRISSIIIYGASNFTPHTLDTVLRLGIPCHFFSATGRFIGRICPSYEVSEFSPLQIHNLVNDKKRRSVIGAQIVRRKFEAIIQLNDQIIKNLSSVKDNSILKEIYRHQAMVHNSINQITSMNLSIEIIMGHEGGITREHYSKLSLAIRKHTNYFSITKRSKRPPKNAMNSLLSFLYSLLLGEVLSILHIEKLPISIGILHSSARKPKPALALDFMEPFRVSIADKLALRLINLGQIIPEHFEACNNGVFLTKEGRKMVTTGWQEGLLRRTINGSSPRERIQIAAQNFKKELFG